MTAPVRQPQPATAEDTADACASAVASAHASAAAVTDTHAYASVNEKHLSCTLAIVCSSVCDEYQELAMVLCMHIVHLLLCARCHGRICIVAAPHTPHPDSTRTCAKANASSDLNTASKSFTRTLSPFAQAAENASATAPHSRNQRHGQASIPSSTLHPLYT